MATFVYSDTKPNASFRELSTYDSSAVIGNTFVLSEGVSYYYRLRNWDGYEWSDFYSIEDKFKINYKPSKPVLKTPGIPQLEALPLSAFSWTSSDSDLDVLSYQLVFSTSPAFDSAGIVSADLLTDNISLQSFGGYDSLLDDGYYYWMVRSKDYYQWSDYSDSGFIFVNKVNTTPQPPASAFLPADGAVITDTRIVLSWSQASDGDISDTAGTLRYDLRLSTSSLFDSYLPITSTYAETSAQTVNTRDNIKYYWQVRALDDEGLYSSWSDTKYFYIDLYNDTPAAPPVSSVGSDSGIVKTQKPEFTWLPASDSDIFDTAGALSYIIEVTTSVSPGAVPYVTLVTLPGETHIALDTPLPDNSIYYFRIKTKDASGATSGFSEGGMFIVDTVPDTPLPVPLISTSAGGLLTLSDTFAWPKSVDPDLFDTVYYRLEVSYDSGFANPVYSMTDIVNTYASVRALASEGAFPAENRHYYLRLRAYDSTGLFSEYSPANTYFFNNYNDLPVIYSFSVDTSGIILGSSLKFDSLYSDSDMDTVYVNYSIYRNSVKLLDTLADTLLVSDYFVFGDSVQITATPTDGVSTGASKSVGPYVINDTDIFYIIQVGIADRKYVRSGETFIIEFSRKVNARDIDTASVSFINLSSGKNGINKLVFDTATYSFVTVTLSSDLVPLEDYKLQISGDIRDKALNKLDSGVQYALTACIVPSSAPLKQVINGDRNNAGIVKLEIPRSAFNFPYFASIRVYSDTEQEAILPGMDPSYVPVSALFVDVNINDINNTAVHSSDSPVRVIIPYLDADANGVIDGTDINLSRLAVYHYNETGVWERVTNMTVYSTGTSKRIEFTTSNFSVFGIFGYYPMTVAAGELKYYPNPVEDRLTIVYSVPGNLTSAGIEYSIYNIAGELVFEKSFTVVGGEHPEYWDCVNSDGNKVASGVYIVRFIMNYGSEPVVKTFKIAVIR